MDSINELIKVGSTVREKNSSSASVIKDKKHALNHYKNKRCAELLIYKIVSVDFFPPDSCRFSFSAARNATIKPKYVNFDFPFRILVFFRF